MKINKYVAGVVAATLFAIAAPVNFTLEWTPGAGWDSNTVVYMAHSTNVADPLTNWTVVGSVPANVTNMTLLVEPGVHYYAAFASNLWGVSPFSNVYGTPPVPTPIGGLKGHR